MTQNTLERPLVRIVDDDPDQQLSLELLLVGEGWDVACFSDGRSFLSSDMPSRLGCVILDVRMPGLSGLEVQKEMKRQGIRLPIIFLTGHGDIDMAVFAMREGAVDFLQKPVSPERLLETVARVVEEDRFSRFGTLHAEELQSRFATLTEREGEIIRHAVTGLLNRQIAERLGIAERTVKVHRLSAYRKLGVHNTAELAPLFALLERGAL